MSQSELYFAGKRIEDRYNGTGQETVVLHFGDHDPSGCDMTRDNEARLCMFANMDVTVERLALNKDQIKKYKPPPNPAKITDSRAKEYIKRHGHSSWELDALEPKVIAELIENSAKEYIDMEEWGERERLLEKHSLLLTKAVQFTRKKESDDA